MVLYWTLSVLKFSAFSVCMQHCKYSARFFLGVAMILNVCPNNTSDYLTIFLHSLSSHFKGLAGDADRLGFALTDVLWTAAVSRWTCSPVFYDSQGPWTDYGHWLSGGPCKTMHHHRDQLNSKHVLLIDKNKKPRLRKGEDNRQNKKYPQKCSLGFIFNSFFNSFTKERENG